MLISDFSIKRPVVAIVASLLLVVFGLYAITQMSVRETPNIDRPNVTVTVNYRGASAEVVETKVVKIIEDQISGISGIRYINSMAKDGAGKVTLEFDENRDVEAAANDVRDQVSRILARLPDDADPPVIQKADSDSDPIITVNIASGTRDQMALADYATITVQPRLASLDGVALVNTNGARRKAMRVWIDRRAMAARELTEEDIEASLRRENVELGAGMIESEDRNFTMRTIRAYQTVNDFSQLVVARGKTNYLIRLGEVAKVELAPVDSNQWARSNGNLGVSLQVIKQPGASTLDVAEAVRKETENIKRSAPRDIEMTISSDSSLFISVALREVTITIVVAALMVMTVIYLFLGTVRAAVIPAVTVPISLVATAMVLWPAGFSINMLTLLAMVLAIGLVVDDAIIMLENIHRRMHLGEPPLLAALRGSRQVAMAVVATTTVLAAAFVPVALLKGAVGSLFKEFAVAMAVAVLFSMFISLTLTPVMCSKILSPALDEGRVSRRVAEIFQRLKAFYARSLNRALDAPLYVVAGFLGITVLAGGLFLLLPQEFAPREDRGEIKVSVRAPEGASPDNVNRQTIAVYETLKPYLDNGQVARIIESVKGDNNEGTITIVLPPWGDPNRRSSSDLLRELTPKMTKFTGATVALSLPPGLGRSGPGYNGGLILALGGPTFDDLRKWRDGMMEGLQANPMFTRVGNNFNETKPQIRVRIDRVRAADLGVSVATIGNTLAAMLGSRKVTTFVDQGEEYDVILQGQLMDRRTPTDVSNIYVRSETTKELIPLSSLVVMEEGSYASGLNRANRRRSVSINVFPGPGVLLGDAIAEIERVAHEKVPATADLIWRGEAGDFKNNSSAIYFSFVLALVVVFLVLAAQFESFLHPLVIMMTVPLAVTGALGGLLLFGQSMNLYSQIGIIVLVGLAAKNGILIVEFTNQLRDEGRPFRDALVEAAQIRLRPIVMTALATAMGAVPLIVATGAGAESRRPIGVVIFTGVLFATLITLFVVPVFYLLLARRTGSPGRVAAELQEYERKHPQGLAGPADHHPAE